MVILVIHNIAVCKNNPYFENFLQKMDILVSQNSPYKMQIGTKSENIFFEGLNLKACDFVGIYIYR
jgi:hypothetical protein